jgi:hypothetical protein
MHQQHSAEDIIRERAKLGDRSKFLAALDCSRDVPDPFVADGEEPTTSADHLSGRAKPPEGGRKEDLPG